MQVTGGRDCHLRVWPLTFNDFLLEAQHEAPVTSLNVSRDGAKVLVGTSAATLGLLDVTQFSYSTILRSHNGRVLGAVARDPYAEEYVTYGEDRTIRVWDSLSSQQRFEFTSTDDITTCGAYHPSEHVLVCGFNTGFVRVFDVEKTETLHECQKHTAEVCSVLFSSRGDKLFSSGCDGVICVYAADLGYDLLRTIAASTDWPSPTPSTKLHISLCASGAYLASCGTNMSSLNIYDTREYLPHFNFSVTTYLSFRSNIPKLVTNFFSSDASGLDVLFPPTRTSLLQTTKNDPVCLSH